MLLKGKGYRHKLIASLKAVIAWFVYKRLNILDRRSFLGICTKADEDISAQWFADETLSNFPEGNEKTIDEKLISRQFVYLGYEGDFEIQSIPWHLDPLSNHVWGKRYYKILWPVFNVSDKTDGKMPYELSRFQHLPSMAGVYVSTGDSRYTAEALCQISDWITENPCPYGINWTCPMDAAIRACNWMWAWWTFRGTDQWTEDFNTRFLKSMWQHGWYIEKNLENKDGIETNHYLSNVVGLLFIGVMFPKFKGAKRWKNFGAKEIARCMEEMVYDDGVSFENSIAYHRLVLEFFTYSALLCRNNDIELPTRFWDRLERMFEFILHTMRPDGWMPMIGDNDDGRFFILNDYYNWERSDFQYLLSIGAMIFRRPDFKLTAAMAHDEI